MCSLHHRVQVSCTSGDLESYSTSCKGSTWGIPTKQSENQPNLSPGEEGGSLMAPKPPQPKPVTRFALGAYMFGVQEAGSIREPMLGLYVGDGTLSRYCVWFSSFKQHAIDLATMKNTALKWNVFSKLSGNTKLTWYTVQNRITIVEFVPDDNRTQIGIAQQRNDSFLVRFIISYNSDKDRRSFMVEYPGVAPRDLYGKVFWGSLRIAGDTPSSVSFLFPQRS